MPDSPTPGGASEDWLQIEVTAAAVDLDTVAEVLGEFAPEGTWIEPAIATSDTRDFSYTLLDTPGRVGAAVRAPWPEESRFALEARLASSALSAPAQVAVRPVEPTDWSEEWKRFYRVQHIGRRLVVRPTWESYDPAPHEVVVLLDPGSAFGTGQHASTRLCLAALERHVRGGERLLDVGCGSGVLAVAALVLGAARARAIDIDPEAIEATRANAALNGVDARVEVARGSVGADWPFPQPASEGAEVVVANISALVLGALLPSLASAVRPGGLLIGSGFIEDAAETILDGVSRTGLELVELTSEDEWRCIVVRRPELSSA